MTVATLMQPPRNSVSSFSAGRRKTIFMDLNRWCACIAGVRTLVIVHKVAFSNVRLVMLWLSLRKDNSLRMIR